MFLKPKLHKKSKNGFRTILSRRYPLLFFSKNYFLAKQTSIMLDVLLFLKKIMAIYKDKVDQFKKISCRIFRISWNISKLRLFNFFICDFLFLKIRFWGLGKLIVVITATKYFYRKPLLEPKLDCKARLQSKLYN